MTVYFLENFALATHVEIRTFVLQITYFTVNYLVDKFAHQNEKFEYYLRY